MPVQNILIWFNDAVSRSHYIYSLPKTWAFLESLLEEKSGNGGFWFSSHNVLGFNTRPNIFPLFTGYRVEDWLGLNRTKAFTDKQFILRRFEHAGSITAFYEDSQDTVGSPWEAWEPSGGNCTQRPAHYFSYNFMKKRYREKRQWNPVCISENSSNMVGVSFLSTVTSSLLKYRKCRTSNNS
jgi:hypothetical protein